MEDGCIDMKRAFHVGLRGSVSNKDIIQEDKAQGWTSFSMDSFVEQGPAEVARRIRKQIGDAPTLVSVDSGHGCFGPCRVSGRPLSQMYYLSSGSVKPFKSLDGPMRGEKLQPTGPSNEY